MASNVIKLMQAGVLMRLAALLNAPSERVQISVCRALVNLLKLPDIRSRSQDKAQVCHALMCFFLFLSNAEISSFCCFSSDLHPACTASAVVDGSRQDG